jgi:hypothetical protein
MKLTNTIFSSLFAVFSITSLIIIIYGARALDSIDVSFTGTGKEHADKYVPGVNKNEKAPDYALSVITQEGIEVIGVKANQFIGSGVSTFLSLKNIPIHHITEIQFEDDDPLENDLLERVAFKQGEIQGKEYRFTVKTQWSLIAGLTFFWSTALGKAILLGITVGVVVIVISNFDFWGFG